MALVIAASSQAADPDREVFEINRLLGRGVNLGNGLEAPSEGEWGFRIEDEYFPLIKKAGFDSVRIPIRWSVRADTQPPYTIDPNFFKRVDGVIEQALASRLNAIINVHHYQEMDKDPEKNLPRLKAIWQQIAERYRDRPESVLFELLNEPHGKLTDELWIKMVPDLLEVIRRSNPRRIVVVGAGHWNNIDSLVKFQVPEQDRRLIVTFHYYQPFQFTHQKASWVQGSAKWAGTRWEGKPAEVEAVQKDFDRAQAWAKKNNRPLFVGEFGAFSAADMESRARWTHAVAREAGKRGISWAYWEFGSGFGVYDPAKKTWREPLLKALVDEKQEELQ